MTSTAAPLLEALAAATKARIVGFGAPAHAEGRGAPKAALAALGTHVFQADMMTPKGLDDRTESRHALQRAHEAAQRAWDCDFVRYGTGGTTQNLHVALSAIAPPGSAVAIAANAHKAEYAALLIAGYRPVPIPVAHGEDWDLEHGVTPARLAETLDAHPDVKAAVVVSPSYFGVASDIRALAGVAHLRGVPLVVDAAWGAAFAFSDELPPDPLAEGADVAVMSAHKSIGALAQGSVLLANGGRVDLERMLLAYELWETTSPSVPILASLDAARAEHELRGQAIWHRVARLGEDLRGRLAKVRGIRVLVAADLPGWARFDPTKVTIDISGLGIAGYAADDWLFRHHGVSVGLSDARHLLAVLSPGTRRRDVRKLARGVRALAKAVRRDPDALPAAPPDLPRVDTLGFELAMLPSEAFFAPAEKVRYEEAAGRIAAEIVAPAPPGVPRLIPGQRISAAHVRFLVANRDAGMFVLDPSDPAERRLRVVA